MGNQSENISEQSLYQSFAKRKLIAKRYTRDREAEFSLRFLKNKSSMLKKVSFRKDFVDSYTEVLKAASLC